MREGKGEREEGTRGNERESAPKERRNKHRKGRRRMVEVEEIWDGRGMRKERERERKEMKIKDERKIRDKRRT